MKKYVADFETTIPKTKEPTAETRVWGYGISEIGNIDNFMYGNNIYDFMEWCKKGDNKQVYFHNLKFDGSFIFQWLFRNGFTYSNDKESKTFNCLISGMGQFYQIEVIWSKHKKRYRKTTFFDSLKKLPFPVKVIAKAFGLPMLKGEIDYAKERPFDYVIPPDEVDYIKNDVQIVASALGIQFDQGLKKMTNGADALHWYKKSIGEKRFEQLFPTMSLEVDDNIRDAYKGGYVYTNPKIAGKDIGEGLTYDVNSLYPWVMYTQVLPYGAPVFFDGKYKRDDEYPLYVQSFMCTFKLKEGKLPTLQVKETSRFVSTEYLIESGGEPVLLNLTSVDMELFLEHYDVDIEEYINGWKFKGTTGLFKGYIEHWMAIKETSEGAIRQLAKLMLNSLYGKFGTNPDVTGKYPVFNDNGTISYTKPKDDEGNVIKEYREPIYIPMACFVTAYARHKTITSAQSQFGRFLYADTDSLHLEGREEPEIEIHKSKIGAWKLEGTFVRGRFLRAKTYVEDYYAKWVWDEKEQKDKKVICPPEEATTTLFEVKCAGMPDNLKAKVTWDNFHTGLVLDGKLMPKQRVGGVVLEPTSFQIT